MKYIYCLLSFLPFCSTAALAQLNGDGDCSPGVHNQNTNAPSLGMIRSTLRFEVGELNPNSGLREGRGRCTGSLINQLIDGKPRQYFVTARHCIHDGDNGAGRLFNLNNVEFVFNFQNNNGITNDIPVEVPFVMANRGEYDDVRFRYAFRSPVNLIYESSSITINPYTFGVDIALMEIVRPIPPHFNVYYAGYKSDALLGPGGVINAPMRLVHHPAGDAKKFAVAPYVFKTNNRVATTCRTQASNRMATRYL